VAGTPVLDYPVCGHEVGLTRELVTIPPRNQEGTGTIDLALAELAACPLRHIVEPPA
jgi:hypothetical protein